MLLSTDMYRSGLMMMFLYDVKTHTNEPFFSHSFKPPMTGGSGNWFVLT